jgi:hypothetical protein
MTNPSATSALDFVDAPTSRQSRCSAGNRACVRAVAIPSAQSQSHKLLQSFRRRFPSMMSQKRKVIPCGKRNFVHGGRISEEGSQWLVAGRVPFQNTNVTVARAT